jgi:small-conductance mechanosensitive channel
MVEAARAQPRVLTDPAPMAFLVAFADSGITLELGFWINDPKTGTLALRSDINLAILRSFRGAGIDIPFPQREVTIRGASGAVVAGEPAGLPGAPRPAPSAAGPSPQR